MFKHEARFRTVVALMGALGALVLAAPPALGHAIVRSTTPEIDEVVAESPTEVVMEFNEPIEINFGAIRVFDTHAERVDRGATRYLSDSDDAAQVLLEPDLQEGTYTVAWNVISADGHPIEEAFVFHVGRAGTRPQGVAEQVLRGEAGGGTAETSAFAVMRWLNFAALLVFVGAFLFQPLVWSRRRVADTRSPQIEAAFARRRRALLIGAWLAVVLATLAGFLLQGAVATQQPWTQALSSDLMRAVADTRYGTVALLKLALLVVVAVGWIATRSTLRAPRAASLGAAARAPTVSRATLLSGGVLAVALLATPGLAGHAGTTPPAPVNVLVDVMHLVAASVWIGGLVMLLLAAFPATRNLSAKERTIVLAPVVARFSGLAFWAVALIVLTGVFAAWVQVQGLSALFGTSYGVALLIKVGAFLPLVALGGINKRWMKPRLERAAVAGDTSAPLGVLKRLVTAEVGLAVLVIAVTAVLVNLAPARNLFEEQDGFRQRIEIDDRTYLLTIDPNRVGDNEVELMLEEMGSAIGGGGSDEETTNHDEPANMAGGPKEVTVLFRMPKEGIGPLPVKARETDQGHFVVRGHQLSVPGRWQLELVVRISRFEEERHEVAVDVNPR